MSEEAANKQQQQGPKAVTLPGHILTPKEKAVTLPGHVEMLTALESEAVNSLKEILSVVTFCMILVLRARSPKYHPAKTLLLAAAVSITTGSYPILT